MLNLISFIIRYRYYIGIVFAVVAFIAAFLSRDASLINKGKEIAELECETQKTKTINDRIEINEKINAVQRPDTNDDYINILRRGEL